MNNITIGIIARDEILNNINIQVVTKNNLKYIHNKCNYIAILNYDNNPIDTEVLKLCDGIIIQGGIDIYPYHFQIVDYCYNNNIPILGICMGHQILGLYSNNSTNEDDLIKINNHYNKDKKHTINIKENTTLCKIFGTKLEVNTRHLYALDKVKKPFIVSATSEDNIIEAIEYIDDEHFLLGVQFHPEDLNNTENLYNYFLKEVFKRKH